MSELGHSTTWFIVDCEKECEEAPITDFHSLKAKAVGQWNESVKNWGNENGISQDDKER